jgi:hypothetical protein
MKTSKKTKTDAMCVDFKEAKQQLSNHHIEAIAVVHQEAEKTWKESEIE